MESSPRPPVSVIVLTYNAARGLEECMRSLRSQRYPPAEVLVVDDGSTDGTLEIAARWGARIARNQVRGGFGLSRRRGVEEAHHPLVAFTDSDCVASSRWLEELVGGLRDSSAAATGPVRIPPTTGLVGRSVAALGFPAGGIYEVPFWNPPDADGRIDVVTTCNALFRREALLRVGNFDGRLRWGGEDTDISRRLRSAGYHFRFVPGAVVHHRPREHLAEFFRWQFRRSLADLHRMRRREFARFTLVMLRDVARRAWRSRKRYRFSFPLVILLLLLTGTARCCGGVYGTLRGH